jgi:hypothetical protein
MKLSELIDQLILELTDWRSETFAGVRKTIVEADGEIIEEWKRMGSPAWPRDGMIAVANAHKGKVKLTRQTPQRRMNHVFTRCVRIA